MWRGPPACRAESRLGFSQHTRKRKAEMTLGSAGLAARATLLRAEQVLYKKRKSAHIGQVGRLGIEVCSSMAGEGVARLGIFVNGDALVACEGFFHFGGDFRTRELVQTRHSGTRWGKRGSWPGPDASRCRLRSNTRRPRACGGLPSGTQIIPPQQ